MDLTTLVPFLRKACPLGASITILVTMVICVIIVKVKHIWVSGLAWPFLSDMGRGTMTKMLCLVFHLLLLQLIDVNGIVVCVYVVLRRRPGVLRLLHRAFACRCTTRYHLDI